MSYDEMELDTLGDRKTALFVIISDTDDTFNFVVAIMYSQMFNLLCDKADDIYNGRLLFMCDACSMSSPISGRYPNSTSSLPPSEAGKSRHPSFCSRSLSSRPSIKMLRTR